MTRIGYLTRVEKFCAGHRLHSSQLDDAENQRFYGECNNLNGHGHNYTVEVTIRGPVDSVRGLVLSLDVLKKIMLEVIKSMDHKNLDKDVPFFKDCVSTIENMAYYFWNQVKSRLDDPSLLYEVRTSTTDKNTAFYRGE